MATRKTITRAQAVRYRNGSRAVKSEILDVVCAVTGYHRDYARRALPLALTPRVVKARETSTVTATSQWEGKADMGTEENKAVVRRFMHEVPGGGNLEVADEVLAPDYMNLVMGGADLAGVKGRRPPPPTRR